MNRAIALTCTLILVRSMSAAAETMSHQAVPERATSATTFVQAPSQPPAGRLQPLPPGPEPPEIRAQQQEAEQAREGINQGRLSKNQLRQILLNHPNPRIREKAQEAKRVGIQLRRNLNSPEPFASLSSLWAFLNPFTAAEAQAQGGISVTLTPQKRLSGFPAAYLNLHGAVAVNGTSGFTSYQLANTTGGSGFAVTKPYAYVYVSIPATSWYVIDFYGYGKPTAKLIKGGIIYPPGFPIPVLDSWDASASLTHFNHFSTVEYLTQGNHAFKFIIETSNLYFYEVSVETF